MYGAEEFPPDSREYSPLHSGVYQMYERLTTRFRTFCSNRAPAAGARFDAGMLYYAPQGMDQ
ncbi:MAG: alpha-galactosidase [Clostridium fessum]